MWPVRPGNDSPPGVKDRAVGKHCFSLAMPAGRMLASSTCSTRSPVIFLKWTTAASLIFVLARLSIRSSVRPERCLKPSEVIFLHLLKLRWSKLGRQPTTAVRYIELRSVRRIASKADPVTLGAADRHP